MTPEELADRLAPIRIPAEFASFGPRDAVVAFFLGVLAALAVRGFLAPLFVRPEAPVAAARRRIAELAGSPEPDRIFGLAKLLNRLDPEREQSRPAELDVALYDPRGSIDPARLERAILDAAGRKGAPR